MTQGQASDRTQEDVRGGVVRSRWTPPSEGIGIERQQISAATPSRQATAVSFTDHNGLVLANAHVQLIFWGSAWGTTGTPTFSDVTNAVLRIISPAYMSSLRQYRNIGTATFQGACLAVSAIGTSPATPPNPFTDTDVQTLIKNLIGAWLVPAPNTDSQLVYCVVMPPNISFNGAWAGEHTYFAYQGANVHYAWVTNGGTLDSITTIFSHELVETCTDPEGSAILGDPGTCSQGGWCEIGDVCEGNFTVVNGVSVQRYWSQVDRTCIVPSDPVVKADKDSKDSKDHKDSKEGLKDKEKDWKEKDKDNEAIDTSNLAAVVGQLAYRVDQMSQQVNELVHQMAIGRAFIRPEERPEVGEHALNEQMESAGGAETGDDA